MKKALIITNHMFEYAGSEILAMEVSELLQTMGYKVEIAAHIFSKQIHEALCLKNFKLINNLNEITLDSYDFIWAQHFLVPLCFDFNTYSNEQSKPFFSVHLSPFVRLELIGLSALNNIVTNIVANSEETKNELNSIYLTEKPVLNMLNAAPKKFFLQKQKKRILKKILIVSNHIPKEIFDAANILASKGIIINIFGLKQANYRRIEPKDIKEADVVISIGKTVQYSILSKKPIYCYDQFGGPGYILNSNYKKALSFNFSGRCCRRKIEGEEIADEILSNYDKALKDIEDISINESENLILENFILKNINNKKKIKIEVNQKKCNFLLADAIRKYYLFKFM